MVMVPAGDSDIERLVRLDADPAVMQFINGGLPSTPDDVTHRIRAADCWLFVATERSTSAFVGWFSICRSSSTERELGYRLGRKHWGLGLATEGASAVIQQAFADTGVDRVWAQTMTVNTASRRVMERCGLTYVRTFFDQWPGGPIDGSEHGDDEYAIRRRAFLAVSEVAAAAVSARSPSGALPDDAHASMPDCPGPAVDRPPR